MSYVVEFAESVHATFRAPNNFCHDLQHVMRGAVKNLSQTCLLEKEPEQLARYQAIFTSLQSIIDTNATMSECTMEPSDTVLTMSSAADYLAATAGSAASDSLAGQRRINLSSASFKSSETAQELTFVSFDQIGAENLSAVLTPEMVQQLGKVYDAAIIIEKKDAELRALQLKVKKYSKHKNTEKLEEAEKTQEALNLELAQLKGVLQQAVTECFPAVYTRILREYIDLCNSLLRATQVGTAILEQGTATRGNTAATAAAAAGAPAAAAGQTNSNGNTGLNATSAGATAVAAGTRSSRKGSVALTVDALEVHEALEEVKQELQQHREKSSETSGQVLHNTNLLICPRVAPAAAAAAESSHGSSEAKASSAQGLSETGRRSVKQLAFTAGPSPSSLAEATMSARNATAPTVAPSKPAHRSSSSSSEADKSAPQTGRSSNLTESLSAISVSAPSPKAEHETEADNSHPLPVFSPMRRNPDDAEDEQQQCQQESSPQSKKSVAPSLASVMHAQFPFWFRYYYFDRLTSSTERLAIAFGLYVSFCKRFVRKAFYTVPLPIKKHMNRIEMEFTTARYARQKREFQAVLQDIFAYRKNLEVLDTYVRQSREAEAHVNKHAADKNKRALEKWTERLKSANDSIEQLRVEVFGRGAEDMIQFYDELLRCIQRYLSELIVTLGGNPE